MGIGGEFSFNFGGGALRGGRRPSSARSGAAQAISGAQSAAGAAHAAGGGGGHASDPYAGAFPEAKMENPPSFYEDSGKPTTLDSGLSFSPDFSEADAIRDEWSKKLSSRSPVLAGFRGVGAIYDTQDQSYKMRYEMAREKALRDAMQKKQDYYNSHPEARYVDDTGVTEEGQMMVRDPLTGEKRLKTVPKLEQEEMAGPYRTEEERPYREVMKQAPVFDPRFPNQRLIGEQQIADDARGAENTKARIEAEAAKQKELETLRATNDMTARRYSEGQANARQQTALDARGEPNTGYIDPSQAMLAAASVAERLAGGEMAWSGLSEKERQRRVRDVFESITGGSRMRGERGGEGGAGRRTGARRGPGKNAPAPKFKKGQVYKGRVFIGEDGANPDDLKNWKDPGR